jgi:hypothetical protein
MKLERKKLTKVNDTNSLSAQTDAIVNLNSTDADK